MAVLSGGAYQRGAILLSDRLVAAAGVTGTERTHQITSPQSGVDSLSQWLRLVPCPTGTARYVLRARIAARDAVDLGGDRSGMGAEVNGRTTAFLSTWGEERIHYWRILIPRDFPFVDGATTNTIIAQVHEGGAGQDPGTPPNFYAQINERNLNFRQTNETYPTTRMVYTKPITPGMEFDFSLRCRWRDGIHSVPWAQGYLQLTVNDVVVWEDSQGVNCWPLAGDARQPFAVAGIYKPNSPPEPSWAGGSAWMYHVGAATGDSVETHASLAAFVAAQL